MASPGLLFLFCRELEKLASTRESTRIPLLVQTRAQKGGLPIVRETRKRMHSPDLDRKEKVDIVSAKQRQSPLSSWIGKQLLGQKIPKRYLDGEGNLQMMQGYPHGLLAIPSDGYSGQRIVVPVEEQKALIKSTHAEIHHQTHQSAPRFVPAVLLARNGCNHRSSLHSLCQMHQGQSSKEKAEFGFQPSFAEGIAST